MGCLFCSIVQKNTPATMIYEDELAVAFADINPKAPIHILVVPKKHISSLAEAEPEDQELLGHLLLVLQQVAKDKEVNGFKTILNTGREGGQVIDHLHFHLLAGKKFTED